MDGSESRRAELVVQAKQRLTRPRQAVLLAATLQLVAAILVYAWGKMSGHLPVALVGILLVTPAPILALAGRQLRNLHGWNLVFGGLMSGVGIWLLAVAVLMFEQQPAGAYASMGAIVLNLVLVGWFASVSEDGLVRAARAIVDPQPARDPGDRGVW
jgi:uncharacterized membrane protein HdeD (DUF308 family)